MINQEMLSKQAMILRLSISQFTGRKKDKDVSKEVEENHNADDAGNYIKKLFVGGTLAEIGSLSGEARGWVKKQTLPWGDNGDRLLMADAFGAVDTEMETYKNKFNEKADSFVAEYDSQIEKEQVRLGSMFKASDYPPATRIRSLFEFRFNYSPLPRPNHFVVNLVNGEVSKIQKEIEKENNRLLEMANRDLWERIYQNVSRMAERLSDSKGIFRDSLVENLNELCQTLKKLNIMNDADLNNMIERIETKLTGEDPDTLRQNRKIRKEVAQEASAILEEIEVMGKRKLNL